MQVTLSHFSVKLKEAECVSKVDADKWHCDKFKYRPCDLHDVNKEYRKLTDHVIFMMSIKNTDNFLVPW